MEELGEAEVEHLDLAVRRQLDIGRFQIAVTDAPLVRHFERFEDLLRDGEGLFRRHRSIADAPVPAEQHQQARDTRESEPAARPGEADHPGAPVALPRRRAPKLVSSHGRPVGRSARHDERPELPAEEAQALANTPWWELFDDPQLKELIRIAVSTGNDPASVEYWGAIADRDQRIVEAADVALTLWLARAQVWQQLSPHEQDRVARWLSPLRKASPPITSGGSTTYSRTMYGAYRIMAAYSTSVSAQTVEGCDSSTRTGSAPSAACRDTQSNADSVCRQK